MRLWQWFPALKPRHTFPSVVRELAEGLRDGSIVVEKAVFESTAASPVAKNVFLIRDKGAFRVFASSNIDLGLDGGLKFKVGI